MFRRAGRTRRARTACRRPGTPGRVSTLEPRARTLDACESMLDELLQLVRGAIDVVVDDHVVELAGLLLLLARKLEALVDLPRALRRPLAQPALELVERRRIDEHRQRAVDRV